MPNLPYPRPRHGLGGEGVEHGPVEAPWLPPQEGSASPDCLLECIGIFRRGACLLSTFDPLPCTHTPALFSRCQGTALDVAPDFLHRLWRVVEQGLVGPDTNTEVKLVTMKVLARIPGFLMIAVALAPAMPAAAAAPGCEGHLDAIVVGSTVCHSPAWDVLVVNGVAVVADLKAEPLPLVRDPGTLPGELGFMSSLLLLAGGAAVAVASMHDSTRLSADDAALTAGVRLGGVAVVSLAGLVAAAALSTWAFDPSTATLRLPLFQGEPL